MFWEVISSVEELFFYLGDILENICIFYISFSHIFSFLLLQLIFSPRVASYIGTLCAFSGNPLGLSWKVDLVPRYICLDSIGAYISIFISFYDIQLYLCLVLLRCSSSPTFCIVVAAHIWEWFFMGGLFPHSIWFMPHYLY